MVGLDRNGVTAIGYYEDEQHPLLRILTREEWGAQPPRSGGSTMRTPLDHVRFTHTNTESCSTHEECTRILKEIQQDHMEGFKFHDITYSFMIGGNGYIYEGRGWNTEPDMPNTYGDVQSGSYEVAYIGEFAYDIPPKEYLKAATEFLVYCVQSKKVSHFFRGCHLW